MNLLPAQPAVSMDAPATDAAAQNNDLPAGLKTLPVILRRHPRRHRSARSPWARTTSPT